MEYKIQKKTFIWEILKINQSQANNSKIDYNKIFLDKTLKEIFLKNYLIINLVIY